MAQISSYPLLVPQLGDSLLGSNIVDSSGNPVIGNPTVQYTISDIKDVVGQNFIQQLYTASALEITPPNNTTGAQVIFGSIDVNDPASANVYYSAANGNFTFRTIGTYYLQLEYNTSGNGGTEPKFAFITKNAAGNQVGPTVIDQTYRQNTASNNKMINIDIMLHVTAPLSVYQFWALKVGTSGSLSVDALAASWTDVPSAGITISKLS